MTSVAALSGGMPQVMTGASMRMPPQQKMANLFDQIDSTGSGSITKAQFEQAFQTMNPPKSAQQQGADAVWAKLDPNGTGSVSKQDFINGMVSQMHHGRHHRQSDATATATTTAPATATASGESSEGSVGGIINTSA